jgi:hypothetical protein
MNKKRGVGERDVGRAVGTAVGESVKLLKYLKIDAAFSFSESFVAKLFFLKNPKMDDPVGSVVGEIVGLEVGGVGASDGTVVGDTVGNVVGEMVGLGVGEGVGDDVGKYFERLTLV